MDQSASTRIVEYFISNFNAGVFWALIVSSPMSKASLLLSVMIGYLQLLMTIAAVRGRIKPNRKGEREEDEQNLTDVPLAALAQYAHTDTPFETLVEHLHDKHGEFLMPDLGFSLPPLINQQSIPNTPGPIADIQPVDSEESMQVTSTPINEASVAAATSLPEVTAGVGILDNNALQ
jgi:hypothetical protein